ncbi:alcohol dehydrogenase catalytic domain-containing protein [Actinomadura citrea]|uniref:alcohol dehydrogenase catalytic domain-containing protein n=1 Tax=Actinomadura citrea TaxID=46158 RepID=UPI0019CDE438|nr:hypothetical protein GCM10010177_82940 [Actinomadura citrea]
MSAKPTTIIAVLKTVNSRARNPGTPDGRGRPVTMRRSRAATRSGRGSFADIWPATFPEGQGNDFAGWVVSTGEGVTGFAAGDEVIGFAPRAAQADYVALDADAVALDRWVSPGRRRRRCRRSG